MAGVLDYAIRKFVPSLPPLTRNRVLMAPFDAIDYLSRSGDPVMSSLPPNRLRVRTGVGNRLLGNAAYWVRTGRDFWDQQAAAGRVSESSSILDLGCGCGRCAITLKKFGIGGKPFSGRYVGLDVDREMIGWCSGHVGDDRFRFAHVDVHSEVYNPRPGQAAGVRWPVEDHTIDFMFAISVFSHLLENDFVAYLREIRRVLRPGGLANISTFCMEDVDSGENRRWSFRHRMGATYVENTRYPEAATGYERQWVLDQGASVGLARYEISPSPVQTCFVFRAE